MASVQSKSIVDGKFVLSNVEIGGGTVGRVFAGEDTIGEPIAVKLMEIESMRESDLQRLNGEVVALSRLHSHPNIVSLKYGGILNEPGLLGYINPFALVLERAHCDLMDYIIDRVDGCLSEDVTRTFMHHICSAVSECHKHSIYHMDIKPENLLIGKDLQLKLADFGVATECKGKMMNDRIGTIAYMAPEVFDGRVYNAEKADVWSIGCVLFIMLCKTFPFGEGVDQYDYYIRQLLRDIFNPFWSFHLSSHPHDHHMRSNPLARDLFQRMCAPNPCVRYTLDEVKNHPWMKGKVLSTDELQEALNGLPVPMEEC